MAPTITPEVTGSPSPISTANGTAGSTATHAKENLDNKRTKKPKIHKRKYKAKDAEPTSPLGVLEYEIKEILHKYELKESQIINNMKDILNDEEIEAKHHRVVKDVAILQLSSNGDGIALLPHPIKKNGKQVCIVPFGLPGDKATIKVYKSHPKYVESDLLEITEKSDLRDNSLINCKYFGKCSGCQFQHVKYEDQLNLKKDIIRNAYRFFAPSLFNKEGALPQIDSTEPSPLKYSYRTKLTPHFNLPVKRPENFTAPTLGFGAKGRPKWRPEAEGGDYSILDIEECPIGTKIINQGLKNERRKFHEEYKSYKKGATFLLRENTQCVKDDENIKLDDASMDAYGHKSVDKIKLESGDTLVKTCVTQQRQIVSEYIEGFKFQFSAGEFFQNNNSILPAVTAYVKSNLAIPNSKPDEPNYLVDAYCGSGLFSITCSENVSKVIGVEVSADSVKFAQINAEINNVKNASFIVGKAERIFSNIDTPAGRTAVILDPPRKGCDHVFLNQLSEYNPAKIVYISCNVHSQARDVEWFINRTKNGYKYEVISVKGFDFFPQTHHVESVAVLSLKK